MFNCEYCDKFTKKKPVKHVNVSNVPPEHWFCSKKCKGQWRSEIQIGRRRTKIEWVLGQYEDQTYFLQKIEHVTARKPFNTRFSYRFFKVRSLERTQRNTLKVKITAKT